MSVSGTELAAIAKQRTELTPDDISYLQLLLSDWALIADLGFADLLLWLPTWNEAGFVAAAQIRPATGRTHIPDDLVGRFVPRGRHFELDRAMANGDIVAGDSTETHEVTQAVPIKRDGNTIAILGRYSGAHENGRLENAYARCADALCEMLTTGAYPRANQNDQGTGGRGGAPRVGDGLMLMNEKGVITFASPNARSAFRRLGVAIDIEGQVLAELVARLNRRGVPVDDTLSLVARGRIQATSEISSAGASSTIRSIPMEHAGAAAEIMILVRDVTDLRRREKALLGKDAAIREIHHRVKNNMQTVASLLRLQGRRLNDDEARIAIAEAGRRVATIAVVHDLLAHDPGDAVDFDEVARRVIGLTVETQLPVDVRMDTDIRLGSLNSDQATPLALVLAELVANAVEHGSKGRAEVSIKVIATSDDDGRQILVIDDGPGMPADYEPSLGLSIVQTLATDELGGSLGFTNESGEVFAQGTRVTLDLPI